MEKLEELCNRQSRTLSSRCRWPSAKISFHEEQENKKQVNLLYTGGSCIRSRSSGCLSLQKAHVVVGICYSFIKGENKGSVIHVHLIMSSQYPAPLAFSTKCEFSLDLSIPILQNQGNKAEQMIMAMFFVVLSIFRACSFFTGPNLAKV